LIAPAISSTSANHQWTVTDSEITKAKELSEIAKELDAASRQQSSEKMSALQQSLAAVREQEINTHTQMQQQLSALNQSTQQTHALSLYHHSKACLREEQDVLRCLKDSSGKDIGASLKCSDLVKMYTMCAQKAAP
jgi:hypothetical protein